MENSREKPWDNDFLSARNVLTGSPTLKGLCGRDRPENCKFFQNNYPVEYLRIVDSTIAHEMYEIMSRNHAKVDRTR